jgi:voltage-gated potassium channel
MPTVSDIRTNHLSLQIRSGVSILSQNSKKADAVLSNMRLSTYQELEPTARVGRGLSCTNYCIIFAVLFGALLAILETEPTLYDPFRGLFEVAEGVLTILFSVEYAARLWSAADGPGDASGLAKRGRFFISLAGLLDLVVLLAAWAPFFTANLALLRIVRLARITRLAKLGRFSRAAEHLHYAVTTRAYELLLAVSLALILLVAGATALYWAEGTVQPDKFGSIPRALWWSAVTLTTIGYGDVSPVTPLGKFIAVLVAVAGIGLVALPTGILASGFSEAVQRDRKAESQ